jgi:hypothetical protein
MAIAQNLSITAEEMKLRRYMDVRRWWVFDTMQLFLTFYIGTVYLDFSIQEPVVSQVWHPVGTSSTQLWV